MLFIHIPLGDGEGDAEWMLGSEPMFADEICTNSKIPTTANSCCLLSKQQWFIAIRKVKEKADRISNLLFLWLPGQGLNL